MTKRPYEVHIEGLVLPAGLVGAQRIRAAIAQQVADAVRRHRPRAEIDIGPLDVSVGSAASAHSIGSKTADVARAKLPKR